MIALTALSSLRVAPDDLTEKMRSILDQPLRREGTLAKLCVTGIVACVGNADLMQGKGRTALVWGSTSGARIEIDKVLDEVCGNGSLPMPFDFIASQCGVAAVYAARFVPSIACGVYLPSGGNLWQQILCMAVSWLEESRYERVLCGWVDEARPGALDGCHASDWVLLDRVQHGARCLARVGLSEMAELHPTGTADAELVPTLQRWLDSEQSGESTLSAVRPVEFHRI